MTFESQYRFANISATKAPILMKFETYVHKTVKNYQKIFRKDSCTHAHTRGVNVRACVLSIRNARAHIFVSCARVCARIFTKKNLVVLYNLTYLSFKFHKDRSVRCGDICKTILTIIKPIRRKQVVSPPPIRNRVKVKTRYCFDIAVVDKAQK